MQYVKVVGETHAEAMRKLRETYGSEAIIYYEKEVPAKTVLSRMMGKKQWMIQAALAEKKGPRIEKTIEGRVIPPAERSSVSGAGAGESKIGQNLRHSSLTHSMNHAFSQNGAHTGETGPLASFTTGQTKPARRHEGEEFLNILDRKAESFREEPFNLGEVAMNIPSKAALRGPREIEVVPSMPGERMPGARKQKNADPFAENEEETAGESGLIRRKPLKETAPAAPARRHETGDQGNMTVLKDLREEIGILNDRISILISNPSKHAEGTKALTYGESEFDRLSDLLAEQGFSPGWIAEFMGDLKERLPSADWKNSSKIYLKAREILATRIKVNPKVGRKRTIVLVGPTGVGKTTTIAKLAARLKLQEQKKVALITADNFRIAATEQIKVYGDIMDIPVHIARNGEQFAHIVSEEAADMILVDTTGVSQFNAEFIEKQRVILGDDRDTIEKHLVVSAVSKSADVEEILEQFEVFGIDRIILSKLDETRQYGAFVELANRWDIPFSFFTTGQRVPDDYLPADSNYLAEKILSKWKKGSPHLN